jgi:hypothetical protein
MGSRFNNNLIYSYTRADGTIITVNGRRRMLATSSNNFKTVTVPDRIDNIAYSSYGDSTNYWAITDQLRTLDPFLAVTDDNVGTSLLIPLLSEINDYESS